MMNQIIQMMTKLMKKDEHMILKHISVTHHEIVNEFMHL